MKTTKELARELGFLRKRSVSNTLPPRNHKNTNHSSQLFAYLIVLDFESTCWSDCKYKTQEIIEFPCVLLNTRSGEIESEFQYYVQPCEHPILSDFCKQLTGITQEQVEQGIPVSLCLRKFQHWINRLNEEKHITFSPTDLHASVALTTIVTWSDWDLGVCLQYECRRKQISKPPHFNSWIDLRATYRKFYSRKPQGLNGALQDVGIEFVGREHSGLCDARNTACLAWRMIKDGCVLSITKTIKPSPSGRPEMVSSSMDTESFIMKPKQCMPVAKPSDGEATITKHVKLTHGTESHTSSITEKQSVAVNNLSNIMETPKAKICRTVAMNKLSNIMEMSKAKICRRKSPKKVGICVNKANCIDSSSTSSSGDCAIVCSVKRGLSVRNSNVNNASHDGNTAVINKLTTSLSKSVSSVVPPGSQKTLKTVNIQSDIFVPTFKTPKPVIAPLVNTFTSTTPQSMLTTSTTPQSMLTTSTTPQSMLTISMKSMPMFKTPSPMNTPLNIKSTTTPQILSTSSVKSMPTFKTPNPMNTPLNIKSTSTTPHMSVSTMKCTPPLCKCGRRSKSRFVQSPGPNVGRFFFSCGQGRGGEHNSGCSFFQWEVESSSRGRQFSRRGCSLGKPYTPVLNMNKQPWNSSTLVLSKRQLGTRSSQNTKCLR